MATQADLDRVNAAIDSLIEGDRVQAVGVGDESTQFQLPTLADLSAEKQRLENELTAVPRSFVVRLKRGFD